MIQSTNIGLRETVQNVKCLLEKLALLEYVCFKVRAINLIQSLLVCTCCTDKFLTMFMREREGLVET